MNNVRIDRVSHGGYVVFNGWKNGRRQDIFSTYNKEDAEAEYKSRQGGNKAVIKWAGRQ